ncbi:MAG: hypothetical protein PHP39_10205 [Oscillospiraceae bacterium]|nr:hypothetical protein [Oscillospiraceae bacterium]
MKKKSKQRQLQVLIWENRGILAFLLALVFVLLLAAFALFNYNSSPDQIDRYRESLEEGDYTAAGRYFTEDIRGNPELEQEAQALLVSVLETIKQNYVNGLIDENQIETELQDIQAARLVANDEVVAQAITELAVLNESRQAFLTAEAARQDDRLADALDAYAQVQLLDPNYEVTQVRLSELRGRYVRSIQETVENLLEQGSYPEAATAVEEALTRVPGDSSLQQLSARVKSEQESAAQDAIITESQRDLDAGRFETALTRLEQAVTTYADQRRFQEAWAAAKETVITYYLAQAETAADQEDWAAAQQAVAAGQALLPDSTLLDTWQAYYSSQAAAAVPDSAANK